MPVRSLVVPQPNLLRAAFAVLWLSSLSCLGACSPSPAQAPPADSGGLIFGADSTLGGKTDTHGVADGKSDGAVPSTDATAETSATGLTVVTIAVEATPALAIGDRVALKITLTRSDGSSGPPTTADAIKWMVNGQPIETGAKLSADPNAQPKLAVFRDTKTSATVVVGVRTGAATLAAAIGGVTSAEVAIAVAFADGAALKLASTLATGKCKGDRAKDTDDTVRLEGKTFGAGGLTLTLRFPAASQAGDVYDLEKPPKSGGLQLVAVVPDLGGVQLKILQGLIWIDQTDKGWYRGTFLGTAHTLAPVVGTFAVERDGKFGIDLLDDGLQIATSTTQKSNQTGYHHSRAWVSAAAKGSALVHWREIHDVTTANLARVAIDAVSGQVTALDPLVAKAVAATLVDDGKGTLIPKAKGDFFGASATATSQGKTLTVWEGKGAKGSVAPYQISGQLLDANFKPTGSVLQIADDECWGDCRPQLVPLPSSRWLAVWGAPNGAGVRAAVLDGNDLSVPEKIVTLLGPPATSPAVASLDANAAIIWRHPGKGTRYRLYSGTLASNGPEQDLGLATANPPPPQMLAIASPPSFAALFFSPASDLKLRRIGLNATVLGSADVAVTVGVSRIAAAAGKPGQVAIIERLSGVGADQPQLRVRKMQITTAGDPGTQLALAVELAASASKLLLDASLTYVADADTYVVVWSGDASSDGVWVQRFR
ncbi:MAG: hypothetical protein EXR77_07685 [Myxococcales bacterium]|nr:hypothetical protein [Myxococcales bacterium]